jgi:hypothetical protein
MAGRRKKKAAAPESRLTAREKVFADLWKAPAYVRLSHRIDHLNRDITLAEAYKDTAKLPKLQRSFRAAVKRRVEMEDRALRAAGQSTV